MVSEVVQSDNWSTVTLGEICDRIRLKNKGKTDNVLTISGRYGLVSQTEFFNKSVASKNLDGYIFLTKGDFAYNKSYSDGYPLGAIKRLEKYEQGIVSTLYLCFRPKTVVNGNFLKHYFDSNLWHSEVREIAQEGGRSHGLLNVGVEDFFGISMTVPSLPEQRKIASILTSVDDAITATQRIIDQTEVVKRGLMQQLLTKGIGHTTFKQTEIGVIPSEWEIVRLDDLAELVTSGSRGWSQYYSTHGALFIRSQDIGDAHLKTGERAYVQVPDGVEGQRTRVQFRDLLISITGNPGNVAMAPCEIGDAFVSQHVALVRLLRPELSPFLTYFLCGDMGQRQFDGNAYGQTRPGLNLKNIRELVVPIPSREEQAKIVKVLDSVDFKLKAEFAHYEQLHNVKRGLMQSLLTGKIRVNVDEPSEVSV